MRRLAVILALVGASLAIGAPSAVAAPQVNCALSMGPVTWSVPYQQLYYDTGIGPCINVDKVEWNTREPGVPSPAGVTGIFDVTTGIHHPTQALFYGSPPLQSIVKVVPNTTWTGNVSWFTPPWCPIPMTTHSVSSVFVYRIHNAIQGTWGPFHHAARYAELIWC